MVKQKAECHGVAIATSALGLETVIRIPAIASEPPQVRALTKQRT
jgi:hypothetical protein